VLVYYLVILVCLVICSANSQVPVHLVTRLIVLQTLASVAKILDWSNALISIPIHLGGPVDNHVPLL
jgi:hypothetical protein